jgi:hypothetical protein
MIFSPPKIILRLIELLEIPVGQFRVDQPLLHGPKPSPGRFPD